MIPHILRFGAVIAGLAALASLGYYALCALSTLRFLSGRPAITAPHADLPPVSILKPLKGTDPEMYGSLRSHCLQDYPAYEIVFGVSNGSDPAVEFVERLKAEFPERAIRVVVCEKKLGANGKVSNLAQMAAQAQHELLLVSDSDIRVDPDYLRCVIAPLNNPKTGMVTCLYRGIAGRSLGSRLEALGISTDFAAGVLAAGLLENGIHFGLGSTLAFRRRDLEKIGGFEVLADYLGDDYEIGRRISSLGLTIELPHLIVETFLPPYSLREFLQHQLRWARNIRHSRRGGYVGLGLTFGIPWALLALLLSRATIWAWALLAAVFVMRGAVAFLVGSRVLQDGQISRWWWMIPLRDCVALGIWLTGFAGCTVVWRGELFELHNGKLFRAGLLTANRE